MQSGPGALVNLPWPGLAWTGSCCPCHSMARPSPARLSGQARRAWYAFDYVYIILLYFYYQKREEWVETWLLYLMRPLRGKSGGGKGGSTFFYSMSTKEERKRASERRKRKRTIPFCKHPLLNFLLILAERESLKAEFYLRQWRREGRC